MKQSDIRIHPIQDQIVTQPLRSRQAKRRLGWKGIACCILIIVSWLGYALLALFFH
ncbi:MAG: hypothetical protein JO025_26840 [Verrucomicrobia bacterium]|nr:hypothetical protein [Verrucomicrobiota bacterium]